MGAPEPTKERLARVLHQAELHELAEKAAAGDYDECESDSALPLTDLACDLAAAMAAGNSQAKEIREAMIRGEFDATDEEWDAWAGEQEWGPDDE